MTKRRLPIGIQTFRHLREQGCYYVDKTAFLRRLIDEGSYYFLSRPRRFGKSLFLDTCKELFEGNEALFAGLAVHEHWDWSVRHPVLRLSFGSGSFTEPGALDVNVHEQLAAAERRAAAAPGPTTARGRFAALLETLHARTGRPAVVLVDEYDRPILDALETPAVARANRDYLRGFYAVVKDSGEHVRFAFLTGVSNFSKVSLFSGLNNLTDITLDPRYSAVCGYTDADLDAVFAPELPGLDRQRIRRRPTASGSTGCWRPTTSRASKRCSAPCSRVFLTPGTRTTTSPTTRVITPACSIPILRAWVWTSRWRTPAATGGSTWPSASTQTSICSSSRWSSRPRPARRRRNCGRRATPTIIAAEASRST